MTNLKRYLLLSVAFISIALGVIGIVLPLLPTTPFFILALACFARSSARFHKILLEAPHIGPILRDWESDKRLDKVLKKKISLLIVCSFAISVFLLADRTYLQLMLIALMFILLFIIKRIDER